ncbi:MAG: hypothetical protein CFE41_03285 [Burkholderiales bacterium PBB2]|nr:MAG: hypothetical protein CFE41_03285 [Burkholderiales bacterium PBB2]
MSAPPWRTAMRLRRAAARVPSAGLSLQELAALQGSAAQGSLLLLLAAPCLLPVPGVGTVLGLGLLTLAALLWRGESAALSLPARVAGLNLPQRWAARVLQLLSRCHGAAQGLLRERLPQLTPASHEPAPRWLAAKVGLMALLIVLPIPFGNVLPALALMLAGLALAARDGLVLLLSLLMAGLATAFGLAVSVLGWIWGSQALSWIWQQLPGS